MSAAGRGPEGQGAGPSAEPAQPSEPVTIKNEKDLQPYEHMFANVDYWKRIGEEYQNPLIVTGTVLFIPHRSRASCSANRKSSMRSAAAMSSPCANTWSAKGSFCKRSSSSSTAGPARRSFGGAARGAAVQPEPQHPRAVVLFRADGRDHPAVLQHPQHTEGPRLARSDRVTAGSGFPGSGSTFWFRVLLEPL